MYTLLEKIICALNLLQKKHTDLKKVERRKTLLYLITLHQFLNL